MTTDDRLTLAEQDLAFRPSSTAGTRLSDLTARLRQAGVQVREHGPVHEAAPVTGACLDSRVVRSGDLYIALPGAKAHGAQFARAAWEAGAAAVLTDADGLELMRSAGLEQAPALVVPRVRTAAGLAAAGIYGHGLDAGPSLLGITGTNGKTTTSFLAASLLEALSRRTGVIGTILTRAGRRAVPSSLTTPESTQLHGLMALMREEAVDTVVMEVSSHAVSYERIAGLRYAVAGFTNLTQDHLDLHGSMQEYFEAKAGLFTAERTARAVIVLDGGEGPEHGVAMAQAATAETTTLALGPAAARPGRLAAEHPGLTADWSVVEATPDGLGHRFVLEHAETGLRLRASVGLPGLFNVANAALAALMVLERLVPDLGLEQAVRAVAEVTDVPAGEGPFAAAVPGRMEVVGREPDGVVDFAHNPDGMVQSMSALARAREATGRSSGRTILVFGATGDRDATKRPLMGRIAAQHADVVVVTDDDPHSEDPATIRAEVLAGVREQAEAERARGRCVEVHESAPRADAIALAVRLASDEDSILLAGRGHETYQDFAGVRVDIDDRVELRARLSERHGPDGADLTEHPNAAR